MNSSEWSIAVQTFRIASDVSIPKKKVSPWRETERDRETEK